MKERFPAVQRSEDILPRDMRVQFKDKNTARGEPGHEFFKGNAALERGVVVVEGPLHVVDMAADGTGAEGVEPMGVVEEAEVFLDLGMPDVVPVEDIGSVEALEEIGEFALGGDGLVVLAILDAEADAFFRGVVGDGDEALESALDVGFAAGFALEDGVEFGAGVVLCVIAAFHHHAAEAAGEVEGADAPAVDDDILRAEALGHVNRLHGHADGALAVRDAMGGELVAIGLVNEDFRGEGAEIMEAGDAEGIFFVELENLLEDVGLEAVAELDGIDAEVENLADDGLAGRLAGGVP